MKPTIEQYREMFRRQQRDNDSTEIDEHLELAFGSECCGDDEGAGVYFLKENGKATHRVLVVIVPYPKDFEKIVEVERWSFIEYDSMNQAVAERLSLHQFCI